MRKWKLLSCIRIFAALWTIQFMEFCRPEYWNGSFPFSRGIFPTQGLNPGLLHCRHILYQLSHKGSPRILEWVTYPFSRGSSQPRNQTWVSCIAGGFFTNWAIRVVKTIKKSEFQRIDGFKLWCWRRLLRVPWTTRRFSQSILKEINPKYSVEGLILKLKLQYFGLLMWRADWLEKTLMLGNIEGRKRKVQQRMSWHHQFNGWANSGR